MFSYAKTGSVALCPRVLFLKMHERARRATNTSSRVTLRATHSPIRDLDSSACAAVSHSPTRQDRIPRVRNEVPSPTVQSEAATRLV